MMDGPNDLLNQNFVLFWLPAPSIREEGKKFNIYLNNESLDFSYKLPGSNMPIIKRTFDYDYYGDLKAGNIEFRLLWFIIEI